MPKTIVRVKTFMCPTGLGNPNASCRFHRASDNLPSDRMCPTCHLELVKSTDPNDKMTMTVMGEEDIETEIEEEGKKAENERRIDISTEAKKNSYRAKRRDDIAKAIVEARKLEDV